MGQEWPDERMWLEARFAALEEKIEAAFNRMADITAHLGKDVERLREDINVLFDRARQVESDVAIVKSDKDDKQSNTATIIAVIAVLGSIAGFLL